MQMKAVEQTHLMIRKMKIFKWEADLRTTSVITHEIEPAWYNRHSSVFQKPFQPCTIEYANPRKDLLFETCMYLGLFG